MKLSIIIPAHNEEQRLPPVLEAYAKFFREKMGAEAEILVVVNGSTDTTASVAERIAEQHPSIRVIDEPGRIGKGGAVILGAKAAVGDYIGFVDADGATSPEEFYRLFQKSDGNDGVIASRWMKGADVVIQQKAMRLLSSRAFNWLTRILLGLKYKDTQCGAKIFRAKAWKTILPNVGTTRFAFDVDVLYQLKRHAYTVQEEPTVWKDIEGSKVSMFNTSVEMFLAVVRMRLLYSPLKFSIGWYDKLLARPVEFLLHDSLFRHAALLFSASILTMFGNIGFQMVTGRMLRKEEFALMTTFLALFALVGRPAATLTTAMVYYTALLKKEGRENCIRRLLFKWVGLTGIVSLFFATVFSLLSPKIATFFHLERTAPVVVCALALPAIFITPVLAGAIRGLQRFGWSAVAAISNAYGRVLFGFIFLSTIACACGWALAGHVVGMYISLVVMAVALFPLFKVNSSDSLPLPSLRLYLAQCIIVHASLALLTTGDIIFVKHYLPEATDFAYAATLSRMVALMAGAVAGSLGPKVVSAGDFSKEHRKLYLRAQSYAFFAVLTSLAVCLLVPEQLLHFFFGIDSPGPELSKLTQGMALAMTPATLLAINVGLLLAQRRFKLLVSVVILAVAYFVSVYLWHADAMQVIMAAGIANLIALIITTVGILKSGIENEQDVI